MKLKKAQGLSLNVVIIAALALIVLVVLVFIFSGKLKTFGQGVESCVNMGGTCTSEGFSRDCIEKGTCNCDGVNEVYIRGTDCEKMSNICCKKVF